jgi:hypothetical protein
LTILEAQVHPLVIVILRFIQILEPLSPLKPMAQSPAGSAGATVQLAIVLPELLKVMSVMVEPIIATWSAPAMDIRMRQITPTTMPLPLFKPTAQSRHGAPQALEVQVRPLVMTIPRFTQMRVPLPPLKGVI